MNQIKMPESVKDELSSNAMSGVRLQIKGVDYVVHELLGKPGQTGVTRRCTDEYGDSYALKFTSYRTYELSRSYLDEVMKARKLKNCANIAKLEAVAEQRLCLPRSRAEENLVLLVMEYVKGDSLADYLNKTLVGCDFLHAFVASLCEALHDFQYNHLYHNDLHDRNIMVCEPYAGSLEQEGRRVKVIDLGEVRSESNPVERNLDDHWQLVNHIASIYNHIQDNRHTLRTADRAYLKAVKEILLTMADEDVQYRLHDARRIKEAFGTAWWNSQKKPNYVMTDLPYLKTPFDYIQAQHIVSDKTLEALFSERCPWYDRVRGPDPINIDGPRGCGKSTVFLMLRLKTLLHTKNSEELASLKEVGFYVPCSTEFGGRFAYLTEEKVERLSNEILDFFNLSVVTELVESLREISHRDDRQQVFGWTDSVERELHGYVLDLLGMPNRKTDRLNGIARLDHLLHVLDQERMEIHQAVLHGANRGGKTTPNLLSDLTGYLCRNLGYFKQRRILFLLDDYSLHRIPAHVQKIFNQVVWLQADSYVFKVSSEVGGIKSVEATGASADVSREFVEVNVGTEYLDLSKDQPRMHAFISDVLDRRLKLAGYAGTARQLLGETTYQDGMTLGRALKEEKRGRDVVYYHGLQGISDLCSGDIAATLDVVRHIFQDSNVVPSRVDRIPPAQQHKAIQKYSREMYSKIRDYTPYGPEMEQLIHAFGWTSRHLLRDHPGVDSRDGKTKDPYEMIRIEYDDDPTSLQLPEKASLMVKELLRRAIFIELPKGRSRRAVLARRLQLRRLYCPAFKMSLSSSEPMGFNRERFRWLLESPRQVCEGYLTTYLGKKTVLEGNLDTLPMFELLESEGN